MSRVVIRALRAGALCTLCALSARSAQDPAPPVGPEPRPPTPLEALRGEQGQEDEIVKLFGQVERRLRAIDRMLYDASSGRRLSQPGESGLGDLLEASRRTSQQVLEEIDRILELARQRAQEQQQSGGSSQDPKPGSSPLDQGQGRPGEREQTPEGHAPQPEPQGKPGEDGQPESPRESPAQGENRDGNSPPTSPTEKVPPGGGDESWGDLPIHVRDLFRAQGGGDLPPRYRDWIDAYYRRLNQRP